MVGSLKVNLQGQPLEVNWVSLKDPSLEFQIIFSESMI